MKFWPRVLAALFIPALLLALLVYLALAHPVPLINFVAQRWLSPDFAIAGLEYRIVDGRLLCHVKGLEYRSTVPKMDIRLSDLAFDLSLAGLRQRQITLNELALADAEMQVLQEGPEPWWQQFSSAEAQEQRENEQREGWHLDVRSIQFRDITLEIEVVEQQRSFDFQLSQFSSGRSRQQERWLQLRGSINDLPMRIDGEALGIREILLQRQPFDIDLDVDIADVVLRANGRLDPFYDRGASDVSLELDVASLPQLAKIFGLTLPPFEYASAQAHLTDNASGFHFDDVDISLRTDNASVRIEGGIAEPFQKWLPELTVSARIDSMKQFLSRIDVDIPVDFYAQAEGNLVRRGGFLELRNTRGGVAFQGFEIAGAHQFGVEGATVRLPKDEITGWEGAFELPLEVHGGTLSAGLKLDDDVLFYDLPLRKVAMMIRTQGMELQGDAAYKGEPIAIDFGMDARWKNLHGRIVGAGSSFAVRSDFTRPWLPFDFEVAVADLDLLNHWLRLDFPAATALDTSGSVRIAADNRVSLHQFKARVRHQHQGDIAVHIPRYEFTGGSSFDFGADIDIPSTRAIAPLADGFIEYINTRRWAYTMEDLSTRADDIVLQNSATIPWTLAQQLQQKPWLEGSLDVEFMLQDTEQRLSLENIELAFEGAELSFTAKGALAQREGLPHADLGFNIELAAHGPLDLPVDMSAGGKLLSKANTVYAEGLEANSGDSRLRLNMLVDDPFGDRPRLVASVNSDYWSLTPFIGGEEEALEKSVVELESGVDAPGEKPTGAALFFSEQSWNLDVLDKFDALVSLRLEQLELKGTRLEKLRAEIRLRDGELVVQPLSLIALNGSAVGAFSRRLEGGGSRWRLLLNAEELDAAYFDSDSPRNNQGLFSARIDLDSRGDSPHQVMANLSGRVTEQASDMVLYGVDLDTLAPNFIRQTLDLLNPFGGEEDGVVKTHLECQLGHAEFGEGQMVIDRSLLIRTPDSTFLVSWFVDFVTEEQRVQLIPRLRRGLGISTTDLARTLQVTGTLLEPGLVVDPEGLLLVGAGTTALYLTGGWVVYFAWRQIERSLQRPDACEKAATKYMNLDRSDLKLPVRTGTLPDPSAEP